jgi:glycosyltransferase involved in cell wall biosynthesis
LEHLHESADEIVVLNTGPTDDTKRLAQDRGAVVRDFVWCDDFAKARNVSLAYCTERFVMWLDADDQIPREDALRLRELRPGERDWDVLHLPYQYSRIVRKMPAHIFRADR